ncbi:hypothetical protein DIPPA_02871 [Diplonema papillatum]|nr:hypothetical protein DIPPA_02871 [Diplonema papillatum]
MTQVRVSRFGGAVKVPATPADVRELAAALSFDNDIKRTIEMRAEHSAHRSVLGALAVEIWSCEPAEARRYLTSTDPGVPKPAVVASCKCRVRHTWGCDYKEAAEELARGLSKLVEGTTVEVGVSKSQLLPPDSKHAKLHVAGDTRVRTEVAEDAEGTKSLVIQSVRGVTALANYVGWRLLAVNGVAVATPVELQSVIAHSMQPPKTRSPRRTGSKDAKRSSVRGDADSAPGASSDASDVGSSDDLCGPNLLGGALPEAERGSRPGKSADGGSEGPGDDGGGGAAGDAAGKGKAPRGAKDWDQGLITFRVHRSTVRQVEAGCVGGEGGGRLRLSLRVHPETVAAVVLTARCRFGSLHVLGFRAKAPALAAQCATDPTLHHFTADEPRAVCPHCIAANHARHATTCGNSRYAAHVKRAAKAQRTAGLALRYPSPALRAAVGSRGEAGRLRVFDVSVSIRAGPSRNGGDVERAVDGAHPPGGVRHLDEEPPGSGAFAWGERQPRLREAPGAGAPPVHLSSVAGCVSATLNRGLCRPERLRGGASHWAGGVQSTDDVEPPAVGHRGGQLPPAARPGFGKSPGTGQNAAVHSTGGVKPPVVRQGGHPPSVRSGLGKSAETGQDPAAHSTGGVKPPVVRQGGQSPSVRPSFGKSAETGRNGRSPAAGPGLVGECESTAPALPEGRRPGGSQEGVPEGFPEACFVKRVRVLPGVGGGRSASVWRAKLDGAGGGPTVAGGTVLAIDAVWAAPSAKVHRVIAARDEGTTLQPTPSAWTAKLEGAGGDRPTAGDTAVAVEGEFRGEGHPQPASVRTAKPQGAPWGPTVFSDTRVGIGREVRGEGRPQPTSARTAKPEGANGDSTVISDTGFGSGREVRGEGHLQPTSARTANLEGANGDSTATGDTAVSPKEEALPMGPVGAPHPGSVAETAPRNPKFEAAAAAAAYGDDTPSDVEPATSEGGVAEGGHPSQPGSPKQTHAGLGKVSLSSDGESLSASERVKAVVEQLDWRRVQVLGVSVTEGRHAASPALTAALRSRAGGRQRKDATGELAAKQASLTEGDVLAVKRVFDAVDADDSGLLTLKELIKYSVSRPKAVPDVVFRHVVGEGDKISFPELLRCFYPRCTPQTIQQAIQTCGSKVDPEQPPSAPSPGILKEVRDVFRQLDRADSGHLTVAQVKSRLFAADASVTEADLRRMFVKDKAAADSQPVTLSAFSAALAPMFASASAMAPLEAICQKSRKSTRITWDNLFPNGSATKYLKSPYDVDGVEKSKQILGATTTRQRKDASSSVTRRTVS